MSRRCRLIIRWTSVAVWFVVAVVLSCQPAKESSATSGWLAGILFRAIQRIGLQCEYEVFHAFLRKAAHFGVHFVLAWLGYRAFLLSCEYRRYAIIATLAIFGVVAFYDELVQSMSPGRAMMLTDALINLSGIALGASVGLLTTKKRE